MEEQKYIPIKDLKDGYTYEVEGRNCCVGIYDATRVGFYYCRHKFGNTFLDVEYHWDIGTINPDMKCYGTVKPIREIEKTHALKDDELLAYLTQHTLAVRNKRNMLWKKGLNNI